LESLSPGIIGHLTALADQALAAQALADDDVTGIHADVAVHPRVADERGEPIRLGRAQRKQLARAIALRQRGARIRISGGREIRLDAKTLTPLVTRAAGIRGRS
jgi:hypothetical protein